MIRLLLVADGERDAATVPHLISAILNTPIDPRTTPWSRLHRGRGYAGKLRFASSQAKDMDASGLVAVVDTDTAPSRSRLREMQKAREEIRSSAAPFPTALGEANPHGEAWLLDDQVAVRRALNLDENVPILTVRKTNSPKETLNALIRQSERAEDELLVVLADIAKEVDPSRATHRKETGFRGFMDEVNDQFGPLLA